MTLQIVSVHAFSNALSTVSILESLFITLQKCLYYSTVKVALINANINLDNISVTGHIEFIKKPVELLRY